MQDRTRILGEELIKALARVDELLEAHDGNKGHAWVDQPWQIHVAKAIAHLGNALVNQEDGTETEASHGACRAIMGLQKILEDSSIERKPCKLHALPPASMICSSMSFAFREPRDPMMSVCSRHGQAQCDFCNYTPMGTP